MIICRFVHSTLNSLRFLSLVLQTMSKLHLSDQPSILYLLRNNMQPSLQVHLLPETTFSSGNVFFTSHQFSWDPLSDNQTIIHNNYVLGYTNKIYRLKEMGLYSLDIDGEYSNENASFLMIDEVFSNHLMSLLNR